MNINELPHLQESHWHKAYWFSRMLISGDKYGAVGKDNQLLQKIANNLKLISNQKQKINNVLDLQKQTLRSILFEKFSRSKTLFNRVTLLVNDLDTEIQNEHDMLVFILTCESIMIPINNAISNIPSSDKEFSEEIAKSLLDLQGEKGLSNLILLWDDLGVKGCLNIERSEIIKAFATLRIFLSQEYKISENEKDVILTSFVQEFERRVAQKRKSRAGGSLEDAATFILNYFKIKAAESPEHFQADIEVDNWVKTKKGWLIGISCKRTLRERWKQVSSADSSILSKFKIQSIFHIVTYDEDLSDDKIVSLGSQRHIFYLPNNSRRLEYAQNHVGLKSYVRPITQLITDLKSEINTK